MMKTKSKFSVNKIILPFFIGMVFILIACNKKDDPSQASLNALTNIIDTNSHKEINKQQAYNKVNRIFTKILKKYPKAKINSDSSLSIGKESYKMPVTIKKIYKEQSGIVAYCNVSELKTDINDIEYWIDMGSKLHQDILFVEKTCGFFQQIKHRKYNIKTDKGNLNIVFENLDGRVRYINVKFLRHNKFLLEAWCYYQ